MIDRGHPVWKAVAAMNAERIAAHQRDLEKPLDVTQTAFVRGKIAALRAQIRDVEGPVKITDEPQG